MTLELLNGSNIDEAVKQFKQVVNKAVSHIANKQCRDTEQRAFSNLF